MIRKIESIFFEVHSEQNRFFFSNNIISPLFQKCTNNYKEQIYEHIFSRSLNLKKYLGTVLISGVRNETFSLQYA